MTECATYASQYCERIKNLLGEYFSPGCTKSTRDWLKMTYIRYSFTQDALPRVTVELSSRNVEGSEKEGRFDFLAKVTTQHGLRNLTELSVLETCVSTCSQAKRTCCSKRRPPRRFSAMKQRR